MSAAKIRLSAEEAELISNTRFILTKNEIIHKVSLLLGRVAEKQQELLKDLSLPDVIIVVPPKIARGENYKGLPWMMLDHPRVFGKEDILAVRTFFWWGNFFSITLHTAGIYKKLLAPPIMDYYEKLASSGFYGCTGDNPWEHHFDATNYCSLKATTREKFSSLTDSKNFLKISARVSLSDWDNAEEILHGHFKVLAGLLKKMADG